MDKNINEQLPKSQIAQYIKDYYSEHMNELGTKNNHFLILGNSLFFAIDFEIPDPADIQYFTKKNWGLKFFIKSYEDATEILKILGFEEIDQKIKEIAMQKRVHDREKIYFIVKYRNQIN